MIDSRMRGMIPRRRPDPSRARRMASEVFVPVPVSQEIPDVKGLEPLNELALFAYRFPESGQVAEATLFVEQFDGKARVELWADGKHAYSIPVAQGENPLASNLECPRHGKVELRLVAEGSGPVTLKGISVCMVVNVVRAVKAVKAAETDDGV